MLKEQLGSFSETENKILPLPSEHYRYWVITKKLDLGSIG